MNRIYIILIILGILVSGYLVHERVSVEESNDSISLIMDMQLIEENSQDHIMENLSNQGINALGVHMLSLEEMEENKQISFFTGRELNLLREFGHELNQMEDDTLYIRGGSQELLHDIKTILSNTETEHKVEFSNGSLLIKNFNTDILERPLLFNREHLELAEELGVKLVPRLSPDITIEEMNFHLTELQENYELDHVIFAGEEILGYPDEIVQLRDLFTQFQLDFGFIEPFITYQDGSRELAGELNDSVVRVHSVPDDEVESLTEGEASARFYRAVTERNVRSLYLKPFQNDGMTVNYINELNDSLKSSNYKLDGSTGFSPLGEHQPLRYVVMLSLIALGAYFSSFSSHRFSQLLFFGGLSALLVSYILNIQLIYQLMALFGAIVIPLACFVIIKIDIVSRKSPTLTNTYWSYIKVLILTLVGGLMIHGVLFEIDYLYQAKAFRGVKLSFSLPLLLGGLYYCYYRFEGLTNIKTFVLSFLNRPIYIKELLVGVVLLSFFMLYIIRTGNEPLLPVSDLELYIREGLEQVMNYRPRFKSFLIGHPLLILGTYLSVKKPDYLLLSLVGLIGPITIINSFSHLHTPVLVSLQREVYGGVLGALIGGLLIVLYQRWENR